MEIVALSKDISPSAQIGKGVKIQAEILRVGPNAVIDDEVSIEGQVITIEEDASIGSRVRIRADQLNIGYRTQISSDCKLLGTRKKANKIAFGDHCYLGESSAVLMPVFAVGDYVTIHNHLLANGYKPCYIGHNTWIGQNCVLNSTDDLVIGNNVGIGAYSSVYTHAFNGELLEGCQVFNVAPVVIEDNVWIVGSYNVISPGVTLGARSMILTGSVVSKSVPPMHCVGGVPAKDLTDKIVPFREVTVDEKFEIMEKFVHEFVDEIYPGQYELVSSGFRIKPEKGQPFRVLVREEFRDGELDTDEVVVVYTKSNQASHDYPNVSVFDLSTKRYTKRRTEPEIQIIKFMNGYRSRFVPTSCPRIGPDEVKP